MATEDEAREAADGTEVKVEAVDLGTVHLQAHPEGKLSSLMEIKSVEEIIDSTEGTLNIPEDQVLVESPSDVQLPPEHNLNGKASSLNGHTDKEEKVSNEQPHDSDQSNGINKEDVTDGISHGESTTEDSCLLKHKKDEDTKGDDQQDLAVTVDDDSVQEDTVKTDSAIQQTDDGQQDQNQEPEKANENTEPASITKNADELTHDGQQDQEEPETANENTEPASIANNAEVEIVAEAATGLQAPVEKRMDNSDDIPETIDEKTDEPAKADGIVHPEEVAKVEDQQSQQADTMDADVALEEIKCEETDQQEEKPKSEAHEPTIDAQGALNQESAEETDDQMNEKIEETVHQRDVAASKETTLEHEATMSAPPVNTQMKNQESLEEIEDTEAEIQPSSGFGDAIPEDQSNLGVKIDNDTVNADTVRAIEQQNDGQQDMDLELEKATEHTQSASMTSIPHAEIVTEAPSGVQTPGETNLDNSDAVPDTIDANAETDEPAKAHAVVHPDQKESFPEDISTAESTEEVVKAEDQQSQQADVMDANMVQEEVPKSEQSDDPATDALEVLNQESAEEIDGPVNTERTAHKETTPEYDTATRDPPVDIRAQNQESLEEREATVEEREVAEAVDTEAPMQQSSIAFEEAVPEDQHNLGVTNNTVQEDTLEATGKTKDGEQYQDLGPENATKDTQPANTETDEPDKAHDVVHPDKKESFPEDTSITEPAEEVVRLEDQQSQQADAMDADMVQEVEPKSEHNDEPATEALEVLNQESAEETNGPVNEKTEETAQKSNMPESDVTTSEAPVTIQVQSQESLEEREVAEAVDTEAPVQQSNVAFEEAVPEGQHYLGVTDNTVQEDTLESTEQTKGGHQYQELGPENATENTQPASTVNIPDVEVIAEAPSEIQTPVEINLDISDAIPDTTDRNTETDEPAKADAVVHPEKKESFSEDTSVAEPTEEVVKVEDQQSQQADTMDADVVQEEVPKSEHTDEPATDALEVLNQESFEETDGPVNEKTEETAHQSKMPAPEETTPEYDATTRELPVNIQVQNQEPLDEREATVEERDIAEVVSTEALVQQSSVALEEAVPEDQHNLGITNNTMQEDTQEAIGQTKDGERHQDVGSENATENTQPASMENIPDVEVITEAPSGIQTSVQINRDISDAIPDSMDGNTETDELVKADGAIHPVDHKESFSEDTCIAEPTEEVIEVDEQLGQQADATDADVLQEEAPKSEHADEPGVDAQEVLNQESTEETDGLVNVNTEETEHKSMVAPEDTMPEHDAQTREPSAYIQEHSQESVGDAEAVHTEAEMQQSSVAFEETTPENHVATIEPCSEIQHVEPEEINVPGDAKDDEITNMSNTENLVQDNILQSGPTIVQPVQELEQIKMDEAANQTHAVFFNDLAQEDATATSEPQVTETEELKDIEATEAEEITKLDHVTPSKEHAVENDSTADEPHNGEIHQTFEQDLVEVKDTEEKTISTSEDTVEDNVAADEPSCGSHEVDNTESTEETKQNIAERTAEASDEVILDETIEQNVQTEDITETHKQDLEPEETKSTEPVESEEASDQRNAAQFDYSPQEDDIQESEMQQTESATEIKKTEPTEVEAKDIITGGISGQSNTTSVGDSAEESNVPEGEPPADIQAVQELGSEEIKNTQIDEVNETSLEMNATVFQMPTQDENPSTTEFQSEEQATVEISSGLKPESIEDNDTEANESQSTSQEKLISTSEESVPEEVATEDNVTTEPEEVATPDVQEVQELSLKEETRDSEAMEPEDQQEHAVSTLEKPAVDSEPNADDQQVHEDKLPEVEDNKAIEADEASKQSNIATPYNAAEERNELESDSDSYAQPAEQVELSKDNENSQLIKAEETSDQSNSVTLEERTTEDFVASEIDPPVDIKLEQLVEEIKGVNATEAEEDFHTSQAEPTSDIQQVDGSEAMEGKKNAEDINDGEPSNISVSEEPTLTDNEATPEDNHVESNEGTIGNETDNVILAQGIKDEIQKSAELKDDACDSGETVLAIQRSENMVDEDAVQTSGNDTVETSDNIHQVKEEPNAGTEHNSSQMSSEPNGENTTHVEDRDVGVQILTESANAEASHALFENDPQAAQDTTENDDTTKGSEQTSDHDSRQHGDVALQQQSCETDALSILEQDEEALQKIDSDQKQKEDEIESQNDELQVDEQKHEEKKDNLPTEPLVEYQNSENGATNKTKDNDAFEAEQTEALHISRESTPSIMDMKVENIKETSEGTEEDGDAKNDNNDKQENAENNDIVAETSTNEQGETTDEIRKEEIELGLVSSVQEASDTAPSEDKILENDPVNAIQESEKEIADEIEESKEIHEDNAISYDELQTNSEKEESPQLCSNEPYNVEAKIDDTTPLCEEIIHDNASIKPREIEEIGENKGLDSTSKPSVESSTQDNAEDSSSHHKVEDEKLSMSEKNDVDTQAVQEKNDEYAADINQTEQCQEEIIADDVLQLKTEENSFDKIEETSSHEETETSRTAATEAITVNEDITDKVSGADGAPSDGSLKTFTDTGRDLDVSLVITTSKEESVENLNLDVPGHPAQDDDTPEKVLTLQETEREMPSSEKLLQTEPGENQIPNEQDEKVIQDENQTPKEKNEEDMQNTEIGEAKKEVEQELPVSHFLMNLILGKENSDANEDSESEAARKQGEAEEDGTCAFISKQEESLGSLPTENKVEDNLTFVEQEKHEVKCSEETQEMVKEQSDDLKLDTERSIETDEDIKKNTNDLEIPAYQDNPQDEISGEFLTGEAAGVSTKMETRDIDISSVELDDRAVGTVCQENMEVSTKNENGSLRSSLNDSTNTKAPEEDTLGEGQTGLVLESLPEDKSVDAVSEQAPSLTESGITDANDLSSDTASVQNPVSAKQDKPTESANIEATCSTDIQLENEEVDKKEEVRHADTATDEVSEENAESSHVNLQKITSSEVTSNELATQITEPVCDTQTLLAHEKEISEENVPTAVEIQADGPNVQINQDKQDEAADNETAMEPEKLGESNFQEHQETGTEQKSPKETDEGDQQLLAKKEIQTQEQDVHETVESPQQTVSIKSNEGQELFDSKVLERDLNVVSPREGSEAEENFVDVTKPEFSTDEEQSPRADAEEKIYDEKINDIEGTKNFTDEAAMKTEAPGEAQKARKKLGLLSGVGSKVKHQLAKVKKAIVGKPGRTKPESPKA